MVRYLEAYPMNAFSGSLYCSDLLDIKAKPWLVRRCTDCEGSEPVRGLQKRNTCRAMAFFVQARRHARELSAKLGNSTQHVTPLRFPKPG